MGGLYLFTFGVEPFMGWLCDNGTNLETNLKGSNGSCDKNFQALGRTLKSEQTTG